jgi:hypothetical protein
MSRVARRARVLLAVRAPLPGGEPAVGHGGDAEAPRRRFGNLAGQSALFSVALSAAGIAIWAWALSDVPLDRMNDLGLVSVLPPSALVGAGLVVMGFVAALVPERPHPAVMTFQAVVVVLVLYGTTSILEPTTRFAATYRHAGIIDYISIHGSVDPNIDAYFNWPGFFAGGALLVRLAGVHNALALTGWASPIFELLYLPPILVILRSATRDERLVWGSVGMFYLMNWVDQDYFSPQACAFLLYLAVLAILLRWFATPDRPDAIDAAGAMVRRALHRGAFPRPAELGRPRDVLQVGLMAVVILASFAIVASHQLTPFALLVTVAALVIARRCSAPLLPVLLALLTAAWGVYAAQEFLSGNLHLLSRQVGNVDSSLQSNVSARAQGSFDHRLIVDLRLAASLGLWLLAAAGALIRRRQGYRDWAMLAPAGAPFILIGLQSYGGEVLLRVFLFGLPFMAFFAASALLGSGRRSILRLIGAPALVPLLVVLFFACRYGNERTDYFTPREATAAQRFYELVPRGSMALAATQNLPWRYVYYDGYDYRGIADQDIWTRALRRRDASAYLLREVEAELRAAPSTPYLVFSRAAVTYADTFEGGGGTMLRLERAVERSPAFRVVYRNRDAAIYTIRPAPGTG